MIYALGIRYVGETTAKTLAKAVSYLLDFKNFSLEELQALEDIGPKVAGSILQFFENKDNIKMLTKLESLGLNFRSTRSERRGTGNPGITKFSFHRNTERIKKK